ncbi:MAG TPA: DUF438 domain-containing protein [Clostridia bacterium]|nr:DUF438 domain-containing protein [Clostridia bacterium]
MKNSEILKEMIKKLHKGASVDDLKGEFRKHFKDVPAQEIADAEKELMEEGYTVEEIQSLCDVHASLFENRVQIEVKSKELGHPLHIFKEENKGLLDFLANKFDPLFEDYKKDPQGKKDSMLYGLKELSKVDTHYSRKENLLFPFLEKAGVTAPPKVMWGVDDEIRAFLKEALAAVKEENVENATKSVISAREQIKSMITKENDILMPLLSKHVDDEGWKLVAQESLHFGYVFTGDRENASPSDAAAWLKKGSTVTQPRNDAPIQLASGFFTVNELTTLFNTLPCDITFVGADDKVHYFSESKDRVFPRTRTIIGRDVEDCHPPKSLDRVSDIVDDFKAGKKDTESFWIKMGEKFILIRYYALRDEEGSYLGVLEVSEDIAPLRALEGEKRL